LSVAGGKPNWMTNYYDGLRGLTTSCRDAAIPGVNVVAVK
jgi:hypothetical protein